MNKEKVIGNLLDIRKLTGGADNPASEEMVNQDLFNIRKITSQTIDELHSKSNMPEVFDNWMNYIEESGQDNIELEFQLVLYMDIALDEPSENLRDWLNEKSSKSFIEKINMCTNAILYGYEVK